jgi:integrase-like protein
LPNALGWHFGFHTLRHTCASLLIESELSVPRLQRWMGHHSPAFPLETYGHLIDGDLGARSPPQRVATGPEMTEAARRVRIGRASRPFPTNSETRTIPAESSAISYRARLTDLRSDGLRIGQSVRHG